MKALTARAIVAATAFLSVAAPFTAHADGYLSTYGGGGYGNYGGNYLSTYNNGGGFSGSSQLGRYGGSGYSGGYGGYNNVAYGYTGANVGPDTPHRGTWEQYTQLRAENDAITDNAPLCGSYDRSPSECKQGTTQWNPLVNH